MSWISEGIETTEINERAAKFKPPFEVSRAQVDYYRGSRKDIIKELTKKSELNALTEGLALKAARVAVLKALAAKLAEEIFGDSLWMEDVKSIGSGKQYEKILFERFNDPLVIQFRGVLDDLAKEMGDRKHKHEHSGEDGKPIPVTFIEVVKPDGA